jgi:hypothetical protein
MQMKVKMKKAKYLLKSIREMSKKIKMNLKAKKNRLDKEQTNRVYQVRNTFRNKVSRVKSKIKSAKILNK